MQKSEDLEKSRNELANAKLQITFIKQLYDDSTAEKDALYDVCLCTPHFSGFILTNVFLGIQRGAG